MCSTCISRILIAHPMVSSIIADQFFCSSITWESFHSALPRVFVDSFSNDSFEGLSFRSTWSFWWHIIQYIYIFYTKYLKKSKKIKSSLTFQSKMPFCCELPATAITSIRWHIWMQFFQNPKFNYNWEMCVYKYGMYQRYGCWNGAKFSLFYYMCSTLSI